jgi:NifB/MoaA-like Fe-S oxidoreductase
VLAPLERHTGAHFELIPLVNTLFGESVTCAGLLPGAAFREALARRQDLDLALIPGEALNESRVFMDDLTFSELATSVSVEVRPSFHFTDVLDVSPGP